MNGILNEQVNMKYAAYYEVRWRNPIGKNKYESWTTE